MTSADHPSPASHRSLSVDTALGEDAEHLRGILGEAKPTGTSIALGERERRLKDALEEASSEGWDGYGAARVSQRTASMARRVLLSLPFSVTEADVQVDPEGEVLLEWWVSSDWILTLAIGEHGRLAYSGLFGRERVRGIEFFGGSLPPAITLALARILERAEMAQAGRRGERAPGSLLGE